MIKRILDSRLPLMVYNPPLAVDADYFESIHRAGGLPVLDTEFMPLETIKQAMANLERREVLFGVRMMLMDADLLEFIQTRNFRHLDLVVLGYRQPEDLNGFSFDHTRCKFFIETTDIRCARALETLSPHGLVIRGSEAPGRGSCYATFILMQWYLENTALPLFIHGGVGWHTAAGLFAAGANGVVLDNQLYLTSQAPVGRRFKEMLAKIEENDSTVLGRTLGCQYRFFSKLGTRIVKDLKSREAGIKAGENPDESLYAEIASRITALNDSAAEPLQSLFYLGQDAVFARHFVHASEDVGAVVQHFFETIGRRLALIDDHDPMQADAPLAREHGTRYPIMQGPMANISDTPEFARRVLDAGALPFFALASLPDDLTEKILAEGKKSVDRFGAGLIGIETFNKTIDSHLAQVKKHRVPFALFAGGVPAQILELEKAGTLAYLHTPSMMMLENAISSGCSRFIFEGSEAGGHVGTLSSLVLWEMALEKILALPDKRRQALTAVFAGGIGTRFGSYFISGLGAVLAAKGVKVGIQVGSAYLFTREIRESGAMQKVYQDVVCGSDTTILTGETVGLTSRTVPTPFSKKMLEIEYDQLGKKIPLSARKDTFEKENIGSLLIGAKGFCPDFEKLSTQGGDICFLEYDDTQQYELGNFMVGDCLTFWSEQTTLDAIHASYFHAKEGLGENLNALEILSSRKNQINDEIAVIGMGCLYPDAASPKAFWENILSKKYSIRTMPADRLDPELYFDPDKKAEDKSYTRLAGTIEDFQFDHAKFGYSAEKARKLSRSQQMILEVAYQAAAGAGLLEEGLQIKARLQAKTAVIVATCLGNEMGNDLHLKYYYPEIKWHLEQSPAYQALTAGERQALLDRLRKGLSGDYTYEPVHGVVLNMEAARIAHHMGARGANYVVDAACATSFTAIDCALKELLSGAHDTVVVGGLNTNLAPEPFVGFSKMGALSARGSWPFDARADGFVLGEGAGILILKRMKDALRDQDEILGVIKGMGASSDGKGKAIAAPNPKGQALALQRCFESIHTKISPKDIGYVEAHGTSTITGDQVEIQTLQAVYGSGPATGVSSVKSQIGHLLGGAGMAGMIKALLALRHKTLPPNGGFKTAADRHDLGDSALYIIAEAAGWPVEKGCPRRAGVSSYGFGGINYHCVVEEFSGAYRPLPRTIFADPAYDFNDDRIVVAGMGVVLPGAQDTGRFWERLVSGKPALGRIPAERFHNGAYAAEEEASGYRIPAVQAGMVDGWEFDCKQFRIPPLTARHLDRAQLFSLDAAAQAIEQAGLSAQLVEGNKTAVILGTIPGELQVENVLRIRIGLVASVIRQVADIKPAAREQIAAELTVGLKNRYRKNTEDTIPGLLSNIVTGRIANSFGCNGANFVVDSSCASSTVAIDLAAKGLQAGDCDYVITGGVDANLYPTVMLAFKRLGLLAEGPGRFFDKHAGGYVMGEGAALQVLTTYRKAVEARMPILGELTGISFASSVPEHLLSPADGAYARAIHNSYDRLSVDKRQIRHLDVFAGSNLFLDAVEKQAIEKSFPHTLSFGNSKPEFGYFKAANPAVVFSKLILMAHHRTLLPHHSFDSATAITGDGPVLRARTQIRTLDESRCVHLASNVNGIGGNHGHMVVGTLPARLMPAGVSARVPVGKDAVRLMQPTVKIAAAEVLPADYCGHYTPPAETGRQPVAGLLSGQGAQFPGMLQELYQSEPSIRARLDVGNRIFQQQRGYDLLEIMFTKNGQLNLTENTQPAVFLSSAAIYEWLSARGFSPACFIGHSVGEYTALFCAGMLDFEASMQLIIKRGDLMRAAAQDSDGRIMVVFKNSSETGNLIETSGLTDLWVANKNSDNQTAVSGRSGAIDRFCAYLKSQAVTCRKLALSGAFHTPLFQTAAEGMAAYLKTLDFNDVPFGRVISNVTARPYPEDAERVKTLLVRQIVSPVEFIHAVQGVRGTGISRFVEIGPGKLLVNLLKKISMDPYDSICAIDPKKGELKTMERLNNYIAEPRGGTAPVEPAPPAQAGVAAPGARDPLPADPEFQTYMLENKTALEQMAYREFLKQKHAATLEEIKKFNFCMEKIVITGVSIGLPGMGNKVFNDNNFDRILRGNNFIEPLTMDEKEKIVDMNITRVFKEPDGNARLVKITRTEDVIQLAGKLGYFNLKNEYGIDFDYDVTISLAIAAGIEALKDARIPLVMHYRETSTGTRLPEGFTLPKEMQATTGVILTSLFPGFETLIDQMNNYYYNKFYVRPYRELENIYYHLMESVRDSEIKEQITDWFFKIRERRKEYGTYKFDRNILFDLVPLGSAHFAQLIKAKGPNIQMSGACASTTQAVGVAQDWIRTGRCDRVIIIGGEAATSKVQSPWIASGFLALGAATVKNVVSEAAKPFDANRNGTILGSGAVSMVIERDDRTRERGLRGQAEILGTYIGNSAFHATKIDVDHLGSEMKRFVRSVENRHDLSPDTYAQSMVFMSHETFTPARGGSADAEITALKQAYPEHFGKITITNTKGFTGHTLGAAIEDAVLVKVLQNGMAPPIANLVKVPAEFSELNFSKQASGDFSYGLHYSAGFGSHFAFLFLKRVEENMAKDNPVYNQWLQRVSGTRDPELKMINNTLCVESANNSAGRQKAADAEKKPPAQDDSSGAAVVPEGRGKPGPDKGPILDTIRGIVAEHTGYTVDMLEPELDLEADLGIDTVKQVEVFSKISTHFNLAVPEDLKLSDLNTIALLADYVQRQTGKTGQNAVAGEVTADRAPVGEPQACGVVRMGITLQKLALMNGSYNLFKQRTVLVSPDRFGYFEAVKTGIEKLGGRVVRLDLPVDISPEQAVFRVSRRMDSQADIHGFIHLAPLDLYFDETIDDLAAAGIPAAFFAVIKKLYPRLNRPGGFLAAMSVDSVVWPYGETPGKIVPAMAGIAGMLKTAAKEMPAARVKVIDFSGQDLAAARQSTADSFLGELMGSDTRVETGRLGPDRFALSLRPQQPENDASCIRSGDTIVVTGGASGITCEILRHLVTRQPVHLVILGRSDIQALDPLFLAESVDEGFIMETLKKDMQGAKPIEIRNAVDRITGLKATIANLEQLRAGGIKVDYHAVDVSDQAAVVQVIAHYPNIAGIIHAAGVEQSQFVPKKTQASFEVVFNTKIKGALNLLAALKRVDYRYFIAFSSVTARFGNEGQIDYTGANDMLGKIVQREQSRHPEKVFKVMAWTAWTGAGMATDETVRTVLTDRGLEFLPLEQGLEHFMAELTDDSTLEVVFSGRDHMFDPDGLMPEEGQPAPDTMAPFLDQKSSAENATVAYRRRLDLTRDLFLLDHSRLDVPIFLGATGIEAMAEAAQTLVAAGRHLVGLRNFSIPYGIKILKGRPKEIVVSAAASKTDQNRVDCKITSRFKNQGGVVVGDETLHYKGVYHFADSQPAAVNINLPAFYPVSHDGDIQALLYHPARLFMDGLFRTVTAIPSFKPDELVTRIQNAGTRPFFKGQAFPEFMTDVAVVDAMFQTGGMLEVMSTSMIVLPYRIGEMTFFRPVERGGEYLCITKKTGTYEKTNEYQLELVDEDGNLFIKVANFEMVKVDRLPAKDRILDRLRPAELEKAS